MSPGCHSRVCPLTVKAHAEIINLAFSFSLLPLGSAALRSSFLDTLGFLKAPRNTKERKNRRGKKDGPSAGHICVKRCPTCCHNLTPGTPSDTCHIPLLTRATSNMVEHLQHLSSHHRTHSSEPWSGESGTIRLHGMEDRQVVHMSDLCPLQLFWRSLAELAMYNRVVVRL